MNTTMANEELTKGEQQVLQVLKMAAGLGLPGLTDEAVVDIMSVSLGVADNARQVKTSTVRHHRNGLVEAGFVEASGARRKGRSGRSMAIWRAK